MTQYYGTFEHIKSEIHESLQEVYDDLKREAKSEGIYSEEMFGDCKFYEVKEITEKLELEPAKVKLVRTKRESGN